jgi:ribose/xylose/arabinose/galactoside ABC-type transport system permease subunit
MSAASAKHLTPYALPGALLAAAATLVASEASRPTAVLDMWRPWGEIGVLATAMTAVILAGGIDLSVGSIIALASVTFGQCWQAGSPLPLAIAAAIVAGFAAGGLNGTLVVLGIAPLVATLATMALYAGLAMALSQGERIAGLPAALTTLGQGSWLGVPNQFVLLMVAGFVALVTVHHTRFGRYLYAIGDSPLAAEFAAVPVRMVQWSLYAASGTVAAAVAIVYAARDGAVVPTAGAGIELQTIACVVLGGTRVTGGHGGIGRTLLGVATLSLLDIALQFVSGTLHVPWSDQPWRFGAEDRLPLIGAIVVAAAIWNERSTARQKAMSL